MGFCALGFLGGFFVGFFSFVCIGSCCCLVFCWFIFVILGLGFWLGFLGGLLFGWGFLVGCFIFVLLLGVCVFGLGWVFSASLYGSPRDGRKSNKRVNSHSKQFELKLESELPC